MRTIITLSELEEWYPHIDTAIVSHWLPAESDHEDLKYRSVKTIFINCKTIPSPMVLCESLSRPTYHNNNGSNELYEYFSVNAPVIVLFSNYSTTINRLLMERTMKKIKDTAP